MGYNRRLMPTFYVDSKNDLPLEIMGFRIIQKINSLAERSFGIVVSKKYLTRKPFQATYFISHFDRPLTFLKLGKKILDNKNY